MSIQDLTFTTLPLCDTAILVSWKPQDNDSDGHRFTFTYQEIRGPHLGVESQAPQTAQPSEGQIKLNNLKENTNYRISVYEEKRNQIRSSRLM